MTIDKLIEKIKHLEWHVVSGEAIRCADGKCPLIAAANLNSNKKYDNWHYISAGESLGFSDKEIFDIVNAADYMGKWRKVDGEVNIIRERFIKELVKV